MKQGMFCEDKALNTKLGDPSKSKKSMIYSPSQRWLPVTAGFVLLTHLVGELFQPKAKAGPFHYKTNSVPRPPAVFLSSYTWCMHAMLQEHLILHQGW